MKMPIVPIIAKDVLDELMAQAVIEHLGLAALTQEKVTHAEVFELGFRAAMIELFKIQNPTTAAFRLQEKFEVGVTIKPGFNSGALTPRVTKVVMK